MDGIMCFYNLCTYDLIFELDFVDFREGVCFWLLLCLCCCKLVHCACGMLRKMLRYSKRASELYAAAVCRACCTPVARRLIKPKRNETNCEHKNMSG